MTATVKLHGLNRLDEPDVEEFLPRRAVGEGSDEPVPHTVALRRLADGSLDDGVEEDARALPLDVRGRTGEVKGGGQDGETDERDQQAGPGCDQGGEDGEPEGSDDEIEEEVEGLEVRAALS